MSYLANANEMQGRYVFCKYLDESRVERAIADATELICHIFRRYGATKDPFNVSHLAPLRRACELIALDYLHLERGEALPWSSTHQIENKLKSVTMDSGCLSGNPVADKILTTYLSWRWKME